MDECNDNNDTQGDIDLVITMVEGIMQTQELIVMSLLRDGAIDATGLKARLEHAADSAARKNLSIGVQFPLQRMLDVVSGKEPPPPRWKPRLIPGGQSE